MPTAILIYGLCGAGKSHVAEQKQRETGFRMFEGPTGKNEWPAICDCLARGESVIVEEITMSSQEYRDQVIRSLGQIPGVEIEWVCFVNDLDNANWNCDQRDKGEAERHREINSRMVAWYTVQQGATPLPIFRMDERMR